MDMYYAHRREDGSLQTVLEHLSGTAEYATAFGEAIGLKEEAAFAAMIHDIGKFTPGFQKRLLHDGPKVDHATAGLQLALKLRHPHAAYAVGGHHAGLPDQGAASDPAGTPTLWGRFKKKPGLGMEDASAYQECVVLSPPPAPVPKDYLDFFLHTHMLFSALVDADWLDTERFMQNGQVERGAGEPIAKLANRFDAWLADKSWARPADREHMTLNETRSDILYTCMDRAALAPGLFSLTVPTGGGKTTASLAFALHHAAAHGFERIIYVIPYTSIIDQTAKTFREILGDENVLEHHAQFQFNTADEQPTPAQKKLQLATENWDAPVIVTTSVQFFESIFSNRNTRNRKLHNIAKSVVIFDEAQMLPVPLLLPCVAVIARLARDFSVSAVLCTATQPSLDNFLNQYAKDLPVRELAPDPARLNTALRRTTIHMAGPMDDGALSSEMNAHTQALCVVNSKRHAQTLYGLLRGEGTYMLSTLLYPAHRERKLEEIRARLKAGLPCRVVSTSLIEAGVDVDFPAVYRALAGLDSILQAAGRCNREGRAPAAESIVTIFEPEQKPPRMFLPNIEAARAAIQSSGEPAALETIQKYFQILYGNRGEGLDAKRIMRLIDQIAFRTISEKFKIIESNTRAVYVLFRDEEAKRLEERLRYGERSRALLRALGRYAVNVYDNHFRALYDTGALKAADEDIWLLIAPSAYSEETGLSLEPTGGDGYYV